jgi:D-aminopeptidase
VAANASGEYALAFSTAHRVPHRADADHAEFRFLRDDARATRQLFRAVVEAVQEAVLSSLCAADEMAGRDGHVLPAFPHELL